MLNLFVAACFIAAVLWAAKKFRFPTDMAQDPEKYPIAPGARISKRELGHVLSNLQRWRKEGKITREEYDHMTDICLSELQQLGEKPPSEDDPLI